MERSTFGRLFTYIRGESKSDPLENFTTESLAAAIREDPSPFVELLRDRNLIPSHGDPVGVLPFTQVPVQGAGILDLVVAIDIRNPDFEADFWIEVKVNSPESGQQLHNYGKYLAE